jgi:hypothetical protein
MPPVRARRMALKRSAKPPLTASCPVAPKPFYLKLYSIMSSVKGDHSDGLIKGLSCTLYYNKFTPYARHRTG